MAFFDFHCHPFTKAVWMLGDRQTLLEENITTVIDRRFEPGLCNLVLRTFGKGKIRFFDSQSSLKQIQAGEGQIIVASLVAMENSYANLDFCIFKRVFQRIENVNRPQLVELGDSRMSYAAVTALEQSLASDFAGKDLQGIRYRLINTFDDIKEDGIINVIMAMEGGHCLYGRPSVTEQESSTHAAEVVEALKTWKHRTDLGELPRLLYITLTHHTTNCLTNHAFGVPPGLAGAGVNPVAGGFNPGGDGLSAVGRDFIRTAVAETNGEKRILIDLKHMSLRARLDFYALRRQMIEEEHHAPFPLIATHMGMTGLSLDDAIAAPDGGCLKFDEDDNCFELDYITDAERLAGFVVRTPVNPDGVSLRFNPWSINLYDEEVGDIVQSGGLLGFSFDSRILGNEVVDRERFSKRERNPLRSIVGIDFAHEIDFGDGRIGYRSQNLTDFADRRYPDTPFITLPFNSSDEIKLHTDLMALCQNIVHAVRVGGPQTWNCICIGSDFDGLINAIDFVPDASAVPDMKDRFRQYLTGMVTALNGFIDEQATGETKLSIPADFYELFVIDNARRFLATHFT